MTYVSQVAENARNLLVKQTPSPNKSALFNRGKIRNETLGASLRSQILSQIYWGQGSSSAMRFLRSCPDIWDHADRGWVVTVFLRPDLLNTQYYCLLKARGDHEGDAPLYSCVQSPLCYNAVVSIKTWYLLNKLVVISLSNYSYHKVMCTQVYNYLVAIGI